MNPYRSNRIRYKKDSFLIPQINVIVIEFYFQTNEVQNAQIFVLFVAMFTNYKCNNFRPPLVMFRAPKSVFFLLNVDVIFINCICNHLNFS